MRANHKAVNYSFSKQIITTVITLIFTVILFEMTNIDLWVQDFLYNVETKTWIINRDDQLTKFIFYDGIKKLFIALILSMTIALIFFKKSKLVPHYKQGLLIVCISALTVTFTVSALKAITNVPCPKDISRYGGNYPHITFSKNYPSRFQQTEIKRCYPAGHAAGGFSLLSLLFLLKKRKSKIITLISVMGVSWSIGGYKMLIGDHFLSHTLISMILAWLLILIIAKAVLSLTSVNFKKGNRHHHSSTQ